jgi:pimeloyl-ACP methyl ester carboxylesterase
MKPTVLNRLIIVDSPGPVFTQADRELMLERMQVKSAAEVVIPESADDVQKLFRLAYFKPPKLPKFLIKDTFEHLFTKYVQEKHELLQYLENNQDALTTEEWTIDRPTLLVWGEQDPLFPVELGHRLAEKIGPNATMHVIPQARHAPNIEYPELFNKAVAGFLDRTE